LIFLKKRRIITRNLKMMRRPLRKKHPLKKSLSLLKLLKK
jgi:hypothetical protein